MQFFKSIREFYKKYDCDGNILDDYAFKDNASSDSAHCAG